jgi:uncharacterized protein (TIRG00374 family)
MKSRKWLVAAAGIIVSLIFLGFAFRNLHPQEVLGYIQGAQPGWLILGAVVYFLGVALISLRWGFLLRSIQQVGLGKLFPLVSIGYMGNNVYPFRAGEMLRILLLQRDQHIPFARATTTVIVERVFDGLVMLTFIAVALLFVEVQEPRVRTVAAFAAPLFLIAVAVFFVLAARPQTLRQIMHLAGRFLPGRLHKTMTRVGDDITAGLASLRSVKDLAGAVACSFGSWMVEAFVYWLVSFAFGLGVSYPVMLLTVGVVNLAGLIPASPGQFGVFETFVVAVLGGVGVAAGLATAYALVIHMVIWLPVTLVGFAFLTRRGLGIGALANQDRLGAISAHAPGK